MDQKSIEKLVIMNQQTIFVPKNKPGPKIKKINKVCANCLGQGRGPALEWVDSNDPRID